MDALGAFRCSHMASDCIYGFGSTACGVDIFVSWSVARGSSSKTFRSGTFKVFNLWSRGNVFSFNNSKMGMKYKKWIIVGVCILLWFVGTASAGFMAARILQKKLPEVGTLLEEVMRAKPSRGTDSDADVISYLQERGAGLVLPVLFNDVVDSAKSRHIGVALALTSDGWTLMPKEDVARFGSRIHLSQSASSAELTKSVLDAGTEFAFVKFNAEGLKVVSFNDEDMEVGERVFIQTDDGMYARRIAVLDFRKNEATTESSDDLDRMWKLDLSVADAKGSAVLSSDGSLIGVFAGDALVRPISHITSALESVLKEGRVNRLSLGVRVTNPVRVETVNEGIVDGLIVRSVQSGSYGAKAGLKVGDVILRIGSEPALTRPLSEFVARMNSGDTLVLTVRRLNNNGTQTEEVISVIL